MIQYVLLDLKIYGGDYRDLVILFIRSLAYIQRKKFIFTLMALVGIAVLSINSYSYLVWNGFIDHGEIVMSSVSWLLYHGHPLYTDLNAHERYSIEHGPIVYIIIGGIMKLLGPGIFTAKLSGFLALLAIMIVSWYWFTHFFDKKNAFWMMGLEAWLLEKWYSLYLNRPDSMMVLCVATSMFFVTAAKKRLPAIFGTAISLGLLINLKADGIFPAIPVLILIYQRFGREDLLFSFAIMTSVGLLPFMLPNISLSDYIQWLIASAAHGLSFKIFIGNISMLIFFSLGILSFGVYHNNNLLKCRQNLFFIGGVIATTLMLVIIGSKHGSGSNHLAPLIPILMYLLIIISTTNPLTGNSYKNTRWYKVNYGLIGLICLTLFFNALNGQGRIIRYMSSKSISKDMINDFNLIKTKYKGNTMMLGYGNSSTYELYRQFIPLLVFDGNPYLVDACALMDMQYSGLAIPDSTIAELRIGKIRIWLIPKGNSPFTLINFYNKKPLFDENFRQTFLINYRLVEQTSFFDIWSYDDSKLPFFLDNN